MVGVLKGDMVETWLLRDMELTVQKQKHGRFTRRRGGGHHGFCTNT